MKKMNTPYGVIYIEDWEYDRHIPAQREEKDIIKLFDSDERFLDYWTVEAVEEIGSDHDMSGKQYYNYWTQSIENGFNIDGTIDRFLFNLGLEVELVSQNIEDIQKFIEQEIGQKLTIEETKNNEYVNRIGNYYILIQE